MKPKEPYSLRLVLVIWNALLCLWSFLMLSRMWQELVFKTQHKGFYYAFCSLENHTVMSSFYSLMYAFSKLVEFGDTAFIILRKQKLIFLHWYHHFTVAVWGFYTFPGFDPANLAFGPLNALIHVFMYGYYALRVSE